MARCCGSSRRGHPFNRLVRAVILAATLSPRIRRQRLPGSGVFLRSGYTAFGRVGTTSEERIGLAVWVEH